MNFKEFIGIDISKLKFDVRIHSNKKSEKFENNDDGFQQLVEMIKANSSYQKDEILFAFEHTGIYSLPLAVFLTANNYHFTLLSGLEIKRSMGIQRGKDDNIDAKRIAEYAYEKREKIKPTTLPAKEIIKIRQLLTLRDRLVKQRAGYLKDEKENKQFLKSSENQVLFDVIDKTLAFFDQQIETVEKELDKMVKNNDTIKQQYDLITSIDGVGKVTALYMIVLTNAFQSFDDWRKFASYAGTAPFPYKSGTSIKGKTKVSQLANKKIKALLNMCARSAVTCNTELKIYYKKRVEQNENKMSAMNIIRNKLLARIFAVVKRGTPYVDTLKFAS